MFKHNLLLAYRNVIRYKSSFIINLVGLTSGLLCTLLIFLWVNDEMGMDRFHEKETQLYQVMEYQQYSDHIRTTTSTSGLLSKALKEEFPEIEYSATTTWIKPYVITFNEHNVNAKGYHVGKDFFNIFSYNLIQGDADLVLGDKYSVVISEGLAVSVFGTTENIVGKSIEFQHQDNFIVTGVFENTPKESSYKFDFVLSYELYQEQNEWLQRWGTNGPSTFVILQEGTDPIILNSKIVNFVKEHDEDSNISLFLEPFANRYLYGSFKNGKPDGGRIEYVRLFTIIAIFILFIACINFMNLSTARASRRAKEIGLKKAIGAQKSSLVWQYLGESILISFISMVAAITIVYLFLPLFNEITSKEIGLDFSLSFISALGLIILLTGLLAGSYPALYLSSFQAVTVLKGEMKGTLGELWARRGLVVFQFALSIILIVSVLVIYKQIDYVQHKNLGYNKENLVYFKAEGQVDTNKAAFLNELRQVPGVINASSTGHTLLSRHNNTSGLSWDGKNPDDDILFENVWLDYGLLETMDIQLLTGRFFDRQYNDIRTSIIFNEAGIKVMGLENPVGKTVKLRDTYEMKIIGVVKDFHFQSLHSKINPLFFILDPENTSMIMARIEPGNMQETVKAMQQLHTKFNPGFTFDYKFTDQQYARLYNSEMQVATLSRYFAGFAILISCLGLFGLASFTAERRIKEIGIRKVLGSSAAKIVYLLTQDFTKMVILAILIGLPVSYYIIDLWLKNFAFHIELKYWYFIASGLVALMVAWLTVGFQAVKSANSNPAECLRDE